MSHFSKQKGFTPTPILEKIGVSLQGKRGFTLIELLVSLAIMAVITTVIMFNQGNYTDAAALRNAADDLGLTFTEAQTYGIAVRERQADSSDFTSAYGVSITLLEQGAQTGYISFFDRNANEYYDSGWAALPQKRAPSAAERPFFRAVLTWSLFASCALPEETFATT